MMRKILLSVFWVILTLTLVSCFTSTIPENEQDDLLKKNHTITLVADNISEHKVTVDDGEALVINFIPQKDNYFFKGWYTDSACTVPYDFSRPVNTSFSLYAGFALKTKVISCKNVNIKALSSTYDNDEKFSLSLVGFDYDYLERNNMGLQFKIMYDVTYKKDYNVIFDIGYAGSPKYEVTLKNDSAEGYFEKDLPTTTSKVRECYTYNTALHFSKDESVKLYFSTDNIQNIISFSDITVVIEAIKLN